MIFFSFSSADVDTVLAVQRELERLGHDIWAYTEDMAGTHSWQHYIDECMQASDRCVLFVSEASMSSRQVALEWEFFYGHKMPIHPVILEPSRMAAQLQPLQFVDARSGISRVAIRLDRYLKAPFRYPRAFREKKSRRPRTGETQRVIEAVRKADLSSIPPDAAKRFEARPPTTIDEYLVHRALRWLRQQSDQRLSPQLQLLVDESGAAASCNEGSAEFQFGSALELLDETSYPGLVVLGEPGAGKSTMLGRLEADLIARALDQPESALIPFCVALGEVRLPSSVRDFDFEDWLAERWRVRYPKLPPLQHYVEQGVVIFLLDGLNEVPVDDQNGYFEFSRQVRHWLSETCFTGPSNRAVFTCRTRDYAGLLNSRDLTVPYARLSPISPENIAAYLDSRLPEHQRESVEGQLSGLFDMLSNPMYLSGFCRIVESHGRIPDSRADIVGGIIGLAVQREVLAYNPLLGPPLLSEALAADLRMHRDIGRMGGSLLTSQLLQGWGAAAMWLQAGHGATDMGLVIAPSDVFADAFTKAPGVTPTHFRVACDSGLVVERDSKVRFCHQLFQEFLAALAFKSAPDWSMIAQDDYYIQGKETLAHALAESSADELLSPIPRTGWEMTLVFALDLTETLRFFDPLCEIHPVAAFELIQVRDGADCLPMLEHRLGNLLSNASVDLRMRIRVADTLGPYRVRKGRFPHAAVRWLEVPAGNYPVGSNHPQFPHEQPLRRIDLDAFGIADRPVTNAEFAEFVDDGGYRDERWWTRDAAKAWRNGESRIESILAYWHDRRAQIAKHPGLALEMLRDGRASLSQAASVLRMAHLSEHELNEAIRNWFAAEVNDQPRFWGHPALSLPCSPVVGVSTYEAEAYCAWRAARDGELIRLLSEWEWEVAAAGPDGFAYPTGNEFNVPDMNTAELRLGRTTPAGIFVDKRSWCGALDMAGNIFEWTSSAFAESGEQQVCRGGSWRHAAVRARATYRGRGSPYVRNDDLGFRLGKDLK